MTRRDTASICNVCGSRAILKRAPDVQIWKLRPGWHIPASIRCIFIKAKTTVIPIFTGNASETTLNSQAACHHVCSSMCICGWQVPFVWWFIAVSLMSRHCFTDVIHAGTLRYLRDSWINDPADRLKTCSSDRNLQAGISVKIFTVFFFF